MSNIKIMSRENDFTKIRRNSLTPAKLELLDKGWMSAMAGIYKPFDLLNRRALGYYKPFPEVKFLGNILFFFLGGGGYYFA